MKSAERKTYLPSPIGTAGTDVPLTLPRGTLKSISAERKTEKEREKERERERERERESSRAVSRGITVIARTHDFHISPASQWCI